MAPKEDLRARNRAAIGDAMPEVLDWLAQHRPRGKLVFDADGRPDVKIKGRSAFGKPYAEHVAEQMAAFHASERRFNRPRPEPGEHDEYGNRFLRAFLAQAKADGVVFADKAAHDESYFLIMLGPGLGGQIDELVALTDCRSIIVADQNPEMLHHSLSTYDWAALAERIRDRRGRLMFVFGDTPEALSHKLAAAIRVVNPCAFDGATVYVDRSSPMLVETVRRFVATDHVVVTVGLGFFNDECLMMRNAYLNFRSGEATVFYRTDDRVVETPVFIVASGPSVDSCIPHIKENADKAIIVSCGTGLRPLLINGIKPDFHVETENISVSPVLDNVSVDHDLGPICLIAASTVERRATEFFNNTIHYFRPGLSPFALFCDTDDYCLRFPSPNIVNAAFSFAQDSGARLTYLFGVDLGVKELGGQHHSQHSYYYDDNALLDPADMGYAIPVKANFGGSAYTTEHLYLTGRQLSLAITLHDKGGRHYNCSDGALIEGFEPMPPDRIKLGDIADGKAKAVDALIESFPVYSKAQFKGAWDAQGLEAAINAYADEFIARARALGGGTGKDYLGPLVAMLHPEDYFGRLTDIDRLEYTAALFLRGSLFMIMSLAEYFLNRITDPDQLAKARHAVETELVAAVERLRDLAIDTLRTPEKIPVTVTDSSQIADEFIPEAPTTWGKVARNAPCPCGSGKRYKNCHGAL